MTRQDQNLCSYCGNQIATDQHHLLKRSTNPDKINEEKNLIGLCRTCHIRTEEDMAFAEALRQIFYYWRLGNVDIFMRAEATIEAITTGQEIEYLTPAMTDNYLTMATAKYGHLSEQMANLEKLWYAFCADRSKELHDKGEKPNGAALEREWGNTTNGNLMTDYKYKLKALEKLQSTLKARLERFRTERFNNR